MRKLVDDFVHRAGVHCESSALRDVFEFYGFPFSESMIFGLGSGLGFVYWCGKPMPYPFVGGRARDFDKNLCHNLSVAFKLNKTSSKTKAYERLRELISKDVPAMVHVDMPFLKYLGLPEQTHFGAHVVVVAGIDEEKGVVYIADTQFEKLQTATLKELEDARVSQFKPFPPENKWFTFEFPTKLTPIEEAIKRGIRKTVETMLEPPIKNLGIKGIRHFANEIEKWPKEYPPTKLPFRQLYEVTYIMLEEDGTGGGCFRYLYSRFLKEAPEHLGIEKVAELGEQYHQIGERWTKVARLIRERFLQNQQTSSKSKTRYWKLQTKRKRRCLQSEISFDLSITRATVENQKAFLLLRVVLPREGKIQMPSYCPECGGEMQYTSATKCYACKSCGLSVTHQELIELREKLRPKFETEEDEKKKHQKEYLKWWLSNKKK